MGTHSETRAVKAFLALGLLIREVLITFESKGERLMKGRSKAAASTLSSKPRLTVAAALQGPAPGSTEKVLALVWTVKGDGADLHQKALCGVTLAAGHANHRIREVIINYLAG